MKLDTKGFELVICSVVVNYDYQLGWIWDSSEIHFWEYF